MDSAEGGGEAGLIVILGQARLPRSFGPEGVLLIEIVADGKSGRIEGISTSLPLPGYNELLRSTLVGKLLEDIGELSEICVQHLRGPIARPTASALANAAANGGALYTMSEAVPPRRPTRES